MFIELTKDYNNAKIYVNMYAVYYIGPRVEGVTFLNFNEESQLLKVKETPEEIIQKINQFRGVTKMIKQGAKQ